MACGCKKKNTKDDLNKYLYLTPKQLRAREEQRRREQEALEAAQEQTRNEEQK